MPTRTTHVGHPISLVLFDGHCALCNRTVRWLLRVDRGHTLSFAPLQGPTAEEVQERHPELASIDSVVYVRREASIERISVESDAVLDLFGDLGFAPRMARLARLAPKGLRDAAYRVIAKHRYSWFGRYETCRIPAPGDSRFLP
jgi:predicted DCC family thiol-disulfide oxidoreductase YuxK